MVTVNIRNKLIIGLSALALLIAAQAAFIFVPAALILAYTHALRPFAYAAALIVACVFFGADKRPLPKGRLSILLAGFGVGLYCAGLLVAGLIFGVARNGKVSDLSALGYHAWIYGTVAVTAETLRYKLMKGTPARYRANVAVILTLAYTLAELDGLRSFINAGGAGAADFFFCGIAPTLILNAVLTCIACEGALPALVLLRGAYSLVPVFLPVLPDVGGAAWAVGECALLFATIILYRLAMNGQRGRLAVAAKRRGKYQKKAVSGYIITAAMAALLIAFNLRLFAYFPVVVLTGSMTGAIDTGAVAFVKKIEPEKVLAAVNVGDVIVYKQGNIEILHRVIELDYNAMGERVYITKGDANQTADAAPVEQWQVLGISRSYLPYIGYPSLWLKMMID
jgi:signal peptidase